MFDMYIVIQNVSDFFVYSKKCISMAIIAGKGVWMGGEIGCSGWKGDCVTVDQCNSSPADAGQIELEG